MIPTPTGKGTVGGSDSERFILALRGIVERFQVTWGVTPLHGSDCGESVEIGFVLDLNGTHKPAANHVGRTCRHCTNLMLALKIIGDWLLPPQGKCSFCEVQAYSDFVRGGQKGQADASSTRALGLVSPLGTRCTLGSCHLGCMTMAKARLNGICSAGPWQTSIQTET